MSYESQKSRDIERNIESFEGEPAGFSALVDSVQGLPVVEVRGEVDLATAPKLLEAIGIACCRLNGHPLVFVDLREVRFIDLYSARTLIEEAEAMSELGGELRLVVPEGGPVARAFELLGAGWAVELHREVAVPEERWTVQPGRS